MPSQQPSVEGFRVCRAQGLRFRAWDLGFRVQGLDFRNFAFVPLGFVLLGLDL